MRNNVIGAEGLRLIRSKIYEDNFKLKCSKCSFFLIQTKPIFTCKNKLT